MPYCVMGGTALAEGRGEILTKLTSMPRCFYVLVKPEFSVSTPVLFRELDESEIQIRPQTKKAIECLKKQDLYGFCSCMHNVFQPVLEKKHPVIGEICRKLSACGAISSCLTGTGSVVFGIFDDKTLAEKAKEILQSQYFTVSAENV